MTVSCKQENEAHINSEGSFESSKSSLQEPESKDLSEPWRAHKLPRIFVDIST